ncbi:MAG TPA: hypothetical protein VGK71_00220, partial [Nitrospirota bacterium]
PVAGSVEDMKGRVREIVEEYVSAPKQDRIPWRGMNANVPVQESQKSFSLPRTPEQRTQPEHNGGWQRPTLLQVFDTYILMPDADGYIVVDQHAAHERIQYEKVKRSFGRQGAGSQGLLVPEKIDLTAREASLAEGLIPELAAIGIEVEAFGGGSFLIRSKPLFMDKIDIKEVVLGLISEMEDSDLKAKAEELREKVYQLIACKSAVKANQRLHPEAMARLIQQLFECETPYACAHGRPTVIRYGANELEKLFKRK